MSFPENLYCDENDVYKLVIALSPDVQNYHPKGFPDSQFEYFRTWAIEQIKYIIKPRYSIDQIETYTEIPQPPPDPPVLEPNPVPYNIKYLCAHIIAGKIMETSFGLANINQTILNYINAEIKRIIRIIVKGSIIDNSGKTISRSNGVRLSQMNPARTSEVFAYGPRGIDYYPN